MRCGATCTLSGQSAARPATRAPRAPARLQQQDHEARALRSRELGTQPALEASVASLDPRRVTRSQASELRSDRGCAKPNRVAA